MPAARAGMQNSWETLESCSVQAQLLINRHSHSLCAVMDVPGEGSCTVTRNHSFFTMLLFFCVMALFVFVSFCISIVLTCNYITTHCLLLNCGGTKCMGRSLIKYAM